MPTLDVMALMECGREPEIRLLIRLLRKEGRRCWRNHHRTLDADMGRGRQSNPGIGGGEEEEEEAWWNQHPWAVKWLKHASF